MAKAKEKSEVGDQKSETMGIYTNVSVHNCFVWLGNSRTPTPEGLEELVSSIRANGILQPLLGRNTPKHVTEIICGARRLRAAEEAGLTHVPVYIRELDDRQAAAAVAAENMSREDFSPLDAYAAVNATLDAYGSHQAAADALARPVGWVRRVAQLGHLTGPWFIVAHENGLPLGFLVELARLPEEVQNKIYDDPHRAGPLREGNLNTLRQMVNQYTALIADCAWLKSDKACAMCAKRSDAEPELFPEYEAAAPECLDIECREAKREAFVSARKTAAAAKAGTTPDQIKTAQWEKGTDKAKKTPTHTVPVVIDQGTDSGKIVWREPEAAKQSPDATPKGPSPQARLAAKFIRQVEQEVKSDTRVLSWIKDASAEQVMSLMLITGINPQDGGHTAAAIRDDFESNQSDAPENLEFITNAFIPRILEKLRFTLVSDCDAAYQWACFFASLLDIGVDAPLKGGSL